MGRNEGKDQLKATAFILILTAVIILLQHYISK